MPAMFLVMAATLENILGVAPLPVTVANEGL